MEPRLVRPLLGIVLTTGLIVGGSEAWAGPRHPDPSLVIPMEQIAPQQREAVSDVIRNHSFHQKGKTETFPCNPRLYLRLLNEPALTLALWKDLSPSPARLSQTGPSQYHGTDGQGTTASWEFLLRSPQLHVLLCNLDYVSPRGAAKLSGRIVLIVRSGYFREQGGEFWVKHDIEAFVKVDSRGWKAVAATMRPLIERLLEDQIQEAGWFVSLMARLVEMYPEWASSVAAQQADLSPQTRQGFQELIAQTRRPGAFSGRPVMVDAGSENAPTVRR